MQIGVFELSLRCLLLLFQALQEQVRVIGEGEQNNRFCVCLLPAGFAPWKPSVDNLLYPRQRENLSLGRSLSQPPPAVHPQHCFFPRWRITLQLWLALLGVPASARGLISPAQSQGSPCQHPGPLLEHQGPGRIFLWVYCRPQAELGSTACLCLSDLMKSAFGFQHSFGSGMKILGLHTTRSELVKKNK